MPDEVDQSAEDENRFDLSEFERELESIFSDPEDLPQDQGDETPDGEDGADGAGEGPSEGEQPTPTPSEEPPADEVQILDRTYSTDDAKALVEFYDWVKSNPQQAIAIDSYLKGQATFTPVEAPGTPAQPAPAAPAVDEEIFEDLPEVVKQKLTQVDTLQQRIDALDQERAIAHQSEVQGAIARGSASFKDRYSLTDDEITELQQIGAGLNVLQGLAAQKGDLVSAVEETLEMAYWRTEKFRDVAVSKYAEQQAADTKRQAKASSLSGGSGSVPRTPKAASTNEDRRLGMVAAITQAMSEQQE